MAVAEERESRSVALETAYVHDVYDQISAHSSCCPASSRSSSSLQVGTESSGCAARVWPRVQQFLQELEPGSIVCDVGCGSGKYLHVNPEVFKVGADRCLRLTELARIQDHEVIVCDNLALPFRDDSFDAVLSVAVVHHFATTERRVNALRELARVLRIGGRLLISVWAMEQRHRKFESQDVLVPWHRPEQFRTPSLELTSTTTTCTTTSEEADAEGLLPYHAYTQTSDSDSTRSVRASTGQQPQQRKRGKARHKGRSIDPTRPSSSQSSSDLSSPNETCYSFVRRALQKLAGGRRGGSRNRAWFLDSWNVGPKDPNCVTVTDAIPDNFLADTEKTQDSTDEPADALDLPIELRRLEDVEPAPLKNCNDASPCSLKTIATCHPPPPAKLMDATHPKSQSLGDILNSAKPELIVRSRSSIARLPVVTSSNEAARCDDAAKVDDALKSSKTAQNTHHPLLVRQKRSLCEDDEDGEEAAREAEDTPGPAPIRRVHLRELVKALPEVGSPRRGIPKQRSLNDELMATHRQREKARVRQNITKQASLNEQLLSNSRGTFGSLKDSFLASPRFQQLRSGFTKLASISTSNADSVKVSSFKNGFVKIIHGWKGEPVDPCPKPPQGIVTPTNAPVDHAHTPPTPVPMSPRCRPVADDLTNNLTPSVRCERRLSREEGSDSSKDSSLQSDTSIDSEDSFASVIFVPKPEKTVSSPPPAPAEVNNELPPPIPATIKTEIEPTAPVDKEQVSVPETKQSISGTIRAETLKRIQNLLQSRTSHNPIFPIVRRSSISPFGRTEHPSVHSTPRLLSLELFNPETDDLDSDSSGVSSPDSVISVLDPNGKISPRSVGVTDVQISSSASKPELIIFEDTDHCARPNNTSASLLEAAANVANSLEGAVDAVIQCSPRGRRKLATLGMYSSFSSPALPPQTPVLDEECRQHLTEFAEKLSERLLREIDQYTEVCNKASRKSHVSRTPQFGREKNIFCPEQNNFLLDHDSFIDVHSERYVSEFQSKTCDIESQLATLTDKLQLNSSSFTPSHGKNQCTNIDNSNEIKINDVVDKKSSCDVLSKSTLLEKNIDNATTIQDRSPKECSIYINCSSTDDVSIARNSLISSPSQCWPCISTGIPEQPPTRQFGCDESSVVAGAAETHNKDFPTDPTEEGCFQTCMKRNSIFRQHEAPLVNCPAEAENVPPKLRKTESYETSLSGSTSQESMQSSSADGSGAGPIGGALTFHRYYHVFKEGELDTLIERYVENLHIISSYYDHANWCVIAEKVQVWTI